MNERFSKLYALPENLYSLNAPVMIVAGALQKDNQTGKIFAQLKIRNIQDKVIKAATIKLTPFDTVGKSLGGTIDYQYLDLSAGRDNDFGQKTPVMIKDSATRSFSISVSEVIFSDNSIWIASNEAWEPLSAPVELETAFHDSELAKQYQLKYGADCKCILSTEKDLWRCACGAINRNNEKYCHSCQKDAATLAALNVDELKADRDERLTAEQEWIAANNAAVEASIKKAKKIAVIAAPILIIGIVAATLISKNLKQSSAYTAAAAFAEAGQYDDAIAVFAELGDYKDSAEQYQALLAKAHPLRALSERISNAGTPVGDILLFHGGVSIWEVKDGREYVQSMVDENTFCKFYIDSATPDHLIWYLRAPANSSDNTIQLINDFVVDFGETETSYTWYMTETSQAAQTVQWKIEGSLANSSYHTGDLLPVDALSINGQRNNDKNIINSYSKSLTSLLQLDSVPNYLFEYMEFGITLQDLGFDIS